MLYVALFQIALGIAILLGVNTHSLYSVLYRVPSHVALKLQHPERKFKWQETADSSHFEITPYQQSTPKNVGLLSLHKGPVSDTFASYPPEPMDWAVLLYQLRHNGLNHIAISAPLVWDQAPDEVINDAVLHELNSFSSKVIGLKTTLSARDSEFPSYWAQWELNPDQIQGDISQLPPTNKLYGDSPQLAVNELTVPYIIENDSLFDSSENKDSSAPLFIRWGNKVIPTFPLIATLQSLGLTSEHLRVELGHAIHLGSQLTLPIDNQGRIQLSQDFKPKVFSLEKLIDLNSGDETSQFDTESEDELKQIKTLLVDEPSESEIGPTPLAFQTAWTIRSLLRGFAPLPPEKINLTDSATQWIVLIDTILVALCAIHFGGFYRKLLFSVAIVIPLLVAIFLLLMNHEWLPFLSPIVAVLFLWIVSLFFHPTESIQGETTEEPTEESVSAQTDNQRRTPPAPSEVIEFNQPKDIPIPHSKQRSAPSQTTAPVSENKDETPLPPQNESEDTQKKSPKPSKIRFFAKKSTAPQHRAILFVCANHDFRSPIAHALCLKLISDRTDISCNSAGLAAWRGDPFDPDVSFILEEQQTKLPLSSRQPLTEEMIEHASEVYVMTRSELITIKAKFPSATTKAHLLTTYIGNEDIQNTSGSRASAKRVSSLIVKAVDAIIRRGGH
jgi:protein-tyrosine-phosphatase